MKDTKRPITFEVSVKLVIFLVVLFLGSASTYAFFIRGYYSLYQDNEKLELIIRSLKTDIGRLQNTITRIKTEESGAKLSVAQEMEQVQDETTVTGEEIITIENLNLVEQGELAEFYFILHKNTEDEDPVRGYLFIAFKKSGTGEKTASFPDAEYRDGKPVNFRLGDRYAIKRFKEYKGTLPIVGRPDQLEVLVYTDMGDLLLRFRRRIMN